MYKIYKQTNIRNSISTQSHGKQWTYPALNIFLNYVKLLSKFHSTLLLKNLKIVEFVKSHLAPQWALYLLILCLTTRNPRDYRNKADGECVFSNYAYANMIMGNSRRAILRVPLIFINVQHLIYLYIYKFYDYVHGKYIEIVLTC